MRTDPVMCREARLQKLLPGGFGHRVTVGMDHDLNQTEARFRALVQEIAAGCGPHRITPHAWTITVLFEREAGYRAFLRRNPQPVFACATIGGDEVRDYLLDHPRVLLRPKLYFGRFRFAMHFKPWTVTNSFLNAAIAEMFGEEAPDRARIGTGLFTQTLYFVSRPDLVFAQLRFGEHVRRISSIHLRSEIPSCTPHLRAA